jgi:hypothetical protein
VTNDTETDGWAQCPQCGQRRRAGRMVTAPVHASHGEAFECDTCEDDRRAACALFVPPDHDPQVDHRSSPRPVAPLGETFAPSELDQL